MRRLIYSMGVSLDGFVAGPGGEIDWSAPDPELHRFHNEQTRELGAHLCGRGLHEVMSYWDTAAADPALPEPEREFAGIWQRLPKVVFSTTLQSVTGNARLVSGDVAAAVADLKREPGGDIGVGGAGLAASLIELGLVDEVRPFLYPVVLGSGTPFLPPLTARLDLELLETRTFASKVVYLRYGLAGDARGHA